MWVLFDEGKLVGLYHSYDKVRIVQKNLSSFSEHPLSSIISEVFTLDELKEHINYYKDNEEGKQFRTAWALADKKKDAL